MFQRATRKNLNLRLALSGPSGSGKTFTALSLACALGDKVAVVDTENRSASRYADRFAFDVLELGPPFHPKRYTEAIEAAAKAGYRVVVIDSLTHAWNGEGGILQIVDETAKRMKTTNGFAAWKEATPIHEALVQSLIKAPLHLIATLRAKQEYVSERDEKTGKASVRKLGMAPIQRDGLEYEFDIFGELDLDHTLVISKSRCADLADAVIRKPGADLAAKLGAWLSGGMAEEPATAKVLATPKQRAQLKELAKATRDMGLEQAAARLDATLSDATLTDLAAEKAIVATAQWLDAKVAAAKQNNKPDPVVVRDEAGAE